MKERALVLGGGGPAGIAWEVGIAAGLAAEGFDFSRADSIIGTSAGSVVGGQLAMGFPAGPLSELHKGVSREAAKNGTAEPIMGIDHLLAFTAKLPRGSVPPANAMVEMGTLALQSKTPPQQQFLAKLSGMFGPNPKWPERYSCCTVNAHDGEFKVWTHADGVDMERAAAASCSVPAIFPPIEINGSFWIDGGVRSWTNADCAVGHRRVVVLAVVTPLTRDLLWPVLERECADIAAAHGRTEVIIPDEETLRVFGANAMDGRRGVDITDAGIAQGRREAARIKALWDSLA